jgi:23S rRNA pseudouridine2604 synthase
VFKLTERTFRIVLTQGLNRQIRRMCEALGYEVVKLKRIRVLYVMLGVLEVGKWRLLTYDELSELRSLTEIEADDAIESQDFE